MGYTRLGTGEAKPAERRQQELKWWGRKRAKDGRDARDVLEGWMGLCSKKLPKRRGGAIYAKLKIGNKDTATE